MDLQTQGSRIVDSNDDPICLKGINIGGWLNKSPADGLQDHLIGVAIGGSVETGRDVTTEREAWAR
jgi:hypothetical protein